MPRRRLEVDEPDLLSLLPAKRRLEILDEVLSARAREIYLQHEDGTVGQLFDAMKADPSWKGLREVKLSQVIRPPSRAPRALRPIPSDLKKTLISLFRKHRGNISAVARDMGHHRFQIQRWIKQFDLDPKDYG
jgi:hypothetical protein